MSTPQQYPTGAATLAMHEQQEEQRTAVTTDTTTNMNHNNNDNSNTQQPRYAATGGITLPIGTIIPGHPMPPRAGRPSHPHVESPHLPEPIGNNAAAANDTIDGEELWPCHKCKKNNLPSKARCSSCQAWRGGKREGYRKKQGALFLPPQFPWKCPCGNENKPSKVRCSKCQKWKGGKRMHNNDGGIASTWLYAQQMKIIEANVADKEQQASETDKEEKEWTCDKCGHTNNPTKVRCQSCPRWKNGKRPKHGKKELMHLIQEEMMTQGIPMTAATIMAATAAARNTGGGIKFAWPRQLAACGTDGGQQQPLPNGNWFCMGCNHLNEGRKARCGSCQRWKFGRRENMKKRNRPHTATTKQMKRTTTCSTAGDAAYKAILAAAAVGGEVEGPPTEAAPVPASEVDTYDRQSSWVCLCGRTNMPDKTRCSSCQKWKGGKRGSLPRKQKSEKADCTAGVFAMTLPPLARVVPNQPNIPWRCAGCGTSNGFRKLRCVGCQSWKNGSKQLSQRTEQVRTEAAAMAQSVQLALADPLIQQQYHEALHKDQEQQKLEQERQRHAARPATLKDEDGSLFSGDWECHGCQLRVPGAKQRCPTCKSWKLGQRLNLTTRKPKPKHWVCQKCKKYNEGERVRCHGCQGWRPGWHEKRLELKRNLHWTCEKCKKENKSSKARCGECQHWKGGQRLNIRKEPRSASKDSNAPQKHEQQTHQNQSGVNVPTHIPPIQTPIASQMTGARGQPPMIATAVNTTTQNLVAIDTLQNMLPGQVPATTATADNMPNGHQI